MSRIGKKPVEVPSGVSASINGQTIEVKGPKGTLSFKATLKLAEMPRNSSATRVHNRCQLTGRPHAYYRKLKLSRIMLRDLASFGQIPGMVKSSW